MKRNPVIEDYMRLYPSMCSPKVARIASKVEGRKRNYPYMSRDCGSDIHQMIEDGSVKFVAHIDEDEAKKWCEVFYTIDFQKGLFITEYYDHKVELKLDNLPTEDEYVEMFIEEDED